MSGEITEMSGAGAGAGASAADESAADAAIIAAAHGAAADAQRAAADVELLENSSDDEGDAGMSSDDEGMSSDGGAGAKRPKRKRRATTKQMKPGEYFDDLVERRFKCDLWFRHDEAARTHFIATKELTCLYGCGNVAYGGTVGNFIKHVKYQKHKTNIVSNKKRQDVLSMFKAQAPLESYLSPMMDLRASVVLNASRYAPRTNIQQIYASKILDIAVAVTKAQGDSAFSQGNVQRDMKHGGEMLREEIRATVKGTVGALVIDEANTKFGGHSKAFGIVYASPHITKPVLLKIVLHMSKDYAFDDDGPDGVKPSVHAVRAIKATLEEMHIDLGTQVTAIIADNAIFNDAIAKLLGVERLRCVSHALALAYAKLTEPFTRFRDASLGLSAFLSAGGGTIRRDVLRKGGINVDVLHCVSTRWGQVLETGTALLEQTPEGSIVFEKIRNIMIAQPDAFKIGKSSDDDNDGAGAHAGAGAGAGAAPAANDGVDPDVVVAALADQRLKLPLKKLGSRIMSIYEVNTENSRRRFLTEFELRLVKHLASDLQKVITLSEANTDNLVADYPERVMRLRTVLEDASLPGVQGMLVDEVLKSCTFQLSVNERKLLIEDYAPKIVLSTKNALFKFDEYIPDALEKLKFRMFYEPKRPPLAMPLPKRGQYDAGDMADFLGAHDPASDVPALFKDYKKYHAAWPDIPQDIKNLGIGHFWRHPQVLSIFGESRALSSVALWYGTRATSSVATERVFGVMRNFETDLNQGMTDDAVDVGLLARCNGWLVDQLVARVSAQRDVRRGAMR